MVTILVLASCEQSNNDPGSTPDIIPHQAANNEKEDKPAVEVPILPSVNAGADLRTNSSTELRAIATNAKDVVWQQTAGPGQVKFSNEKALTTLVSASADGEYRIKITVTSSTGSSAEDEVLLSWDTTPPLITLSNEFKAFQEFKLAPYVEGALSTHWEMVSGPGTATFSEPRAVESAFSADKDGTYVIRLNARDELGNSASQEANVIWNTSTPTVSAGPDIVARKTATLNASTNSSGTYRWAKLYGPGTVSFGSPTALTTTVSADQEGAYILRIRMTNSVGVSTTDDLKMEWHTGRFWTLPQNSMPYLASNDVRAIAANGSALYVATARSMAISNDWGASWINKTTAHGLPSNSIRALQLSGNTLYAGTDRGLAVSIDSGSNWASVTTLNNPYEPVYAVQVIGSRIYLSRHNSVGISLDGGLTWRYSYIYAIGNPIDALLIKGDKIFAGSKSLFAGGIAVSTDNGATWTIRTTANGLPSNVTRAFSAHDSSIFAATSAGLAVSTDDGASWVTQSQAGITALTYSDGTLFAATNYGPMSSSNHGINWTNLYSQACDESSIVASGSTLYLGTACGLGISIDSGANWTFKTAANGFESQYLHGVTAVDNQVYVASSSGLTMSLDGGVTWSNRTILNGLGSNQVSQTVINGSKIYAATSAGLSISNDQGQNWSTKTLADGLGASNVRGIHVSGSNIYAATAGGLSISADNGSSWANKTTLNGLASNSTRSVLVSGGIIYVGTDGGISISTDEGNTWVNKTTVDGLGSNKVYAVAAYGINVYAATFGGLSISNDWGMTWSNKTTSHGLGANDVYGVLVSGTKVYAATFAGLSVSNDNGVSWSNHFANGLIAGQAKGISVNGNAIYLATYSGLVYSQDGGVSWKSKIARESNSYKDGFWNDSVSGVYANGIKIYLASAYNGFYISSDGGATWDRIGNFGAGINYSNARALFVSDTIIYLGSVW
jgi:hypothetical protein